MLKFIHKLAGEVLMTKVKLKKISVAVFLSLWILAVTFSLTVSGIVVWRSEWSNQFDFSPLQSAANKTILFIGDGMGENHIKVTDSYFEDPLFLPTFGEQGKVTTFSKKILKPTDSAAGGSALATGQKFKNYSVARNDGKDIEQITTYAKRLGLGVGVVTTDSLSGATPASFSSHANDRYDEEDIIAGQIVSGVDLFIGAGNEAYAPYKDAFVAKGYAFCDSWPLQGATTNKIIASFEEIGYDETNGKPTLSLLTTYAIAFMEEHFPNGYFMMIEGAHIDKMSHKNKIAEMAHYLRDFDKSIAYAYSVFETIPNSAILVTADHETGGLKFNGQTKEKINDKLYTRMKHSAADVPYFIYLNTTKNVILKDHISARMDNTDIYKIAFNFITPLAE